MKKHVYNPDIFTISALLSHEECDMLIDKSEAIGYEEATVTAAGGVQRMLKEIRNNERVLFKDESFTALLWERLQQFVPAGYNDRTACGLNELFRFYKYSPGQRFKMHRDGSYIKTIQKPASIPL